MTDERVLTVVVIATYGGAGLLGALLFGGVVLTVFLAIAVIWLTWDRDRANERAEVNADDIAQVMEQADADRAEAALDRRRIEGIEWHLDGQEPVSEGRHACPPDEDGGLPQPAIELVQSGGESGEAAAAGPTTDEGEQCET